MNNPTSDMFATAQDMCLDTLYAAVKRRRGRRGCTPKNNDVKENRRTDGKETRNIHEREADMEKLL